MERTHKVLNGFFWFAFAAFLAASIPHVAYFFRAYEPVGTSGDMVWNGVSLAIAISIDVTIFLLSVTVAGLQRQKKKAALVFSVWIFIIVLAALSWYINYKYAEHFVNSSMVSSTPVTLPFIGMIADVNPLIASMFQILAIAYTWIADKIAANESVKTAEELKREADELEALAVQKERIATIKRGGKVTAFKAVFDAGSEVVHHVKGVVAASVSSVQQTSVISDNEVSTVTSSSSELPHVETGSVASTTTSLPVELTPVERVNTASTDICSGRQTTDELLQLDSVNTASTDTVYEHQLLQLLPRTDTCSDNEQGDELLQVDMVLSSENDTSTCPLSGLSSRATVPLDEAAKLLNCDVKYVKTLRSKGTLTTAARNRELITVGSINRYMEGKKGTHQKTQLRSKNTGLKAVS